MNARPTASNRRASVFPLLPKLNIMSRVLIRSLLSGAVLAVGAGFASGQTLPTPPVPTPGWQFCENPANPHSINYLVGQINDFVNYFKDGGRVPLFQTTIGASGSSLFLAGCPGVAYTVDVAGKFGVGSGPIGSVQTTRDDNMQYTFGMPDDVGNTFCYATINVDGARQTFGTGQFTQFFEGVTDRHIICEQPLNSADVTLQIDVLGDAARYQWDIKNTDAAAHSVGLWQGAWIALLDQSGDVHGYISSPDSRVFIAIPGQRPTQLETIWTRKDNPSVFPPYIDFDWSQSEPYGLRIETGPSPSTTDPVTQVSDATQADVFELGNHGEFVSGPGLLGDYNTTVSNFPDEMFPIVHQTPGIQQSDIPYIDNPAYIIKYDGVTIGGGATRQIVQYFRNTWSQSNYAPPYTVVVDVPQVFNYDPNGLNQLTPNPGQVRVWVDNIRGFTTGEQEVPLENVRVTLDLTNTNGITIQGGGKQQSKTIARINSRQVGWVDFFVVADGIATGVQTMQVTVQAPPGPVKTLTVQTDISTTPKVPVVAGSNLLSLPWDFTDSSWSAILGLSQPTQFQAFKWDPTQQGYVLSTSSQRGVGTWITIPDQNVIPSGTLALNSNPTLPSDMVQGTDIIQLSQGWNLIGNPYPYPIPLGDLIGVPSGDPTRTYKWIDLVGANFVSPSLAFWDTTTSPAAYDFISGNESYMQPNTGYWIYVFDLNLTLSFPPVFLEGAHVNPAIRGGSIVKPQFSAVKQQAVVKPFAQSAAQYRLQIAARTDTELDDKNFVGKADSAQDAKLLKILEPPMGPNQNLGLSIAPEKVGETRLAQSLLATTGSSSWTINVQTVKQGGQVTLTWPNMGSVPKNVAFRLTDVATGTSRDMRRTSGYTFTADANGTRVFKVEAQAGTVSRAVIGNVVVTQGKGRDRTAPFSISYTLSADATTSVRILGSGGREIFTATRGRADRVGENTISWAMRDNANRAVAPGVYRVEITAETTDGERVRKIVPINVIR